MYIHADNIAHIKTLRDEYYDSIVTDAPYGLGDEPDPVAVLTACSRGESYQPKGKGFMNQQWDAFVPQPVFWREVFRVLKPGGHVVCFFGTRTYDWGVMAMRFAGFEIRDQLQWIYGQGFPKSLDVSKSIDKSKGLEHEIIGKNPFASRNKNSTNKYHDTHNVMSGATRHSEFKTTGNSPEAKYYEGWGTALKPAHEPIVLARKPLIGTVAANVLTLGTGGLNIDACRIEFQSEEDLLSATFGRGTDMLGGNYVGATHSTGQTNIAANESGRWPANVIMDEEAAAMLDEQTGTLTSGGYPPAGGIKGTRGIYGDMGTTGSPLFGSNSGGASRFFYVPKAGKEEREKGLEHFTPTTVSDGNSGREDTDNPYQRAGTERRNTHPTVKPIALGRYLIRLVTPVGGRTCDPFGGSGSFGISADLEGFDFDCITDQLDHHEIAVARHRGWAADIREAAFHRNNKQAQLF